MRKYWSDMPTAGFHTPFASRNRPGEGGARPALWPGLHRAVGTVRVQLLLKRSTARRQLMNCDPTGSRILQLCCGCGLVTAAHSIIIAAQEPAHHGGVGVVCGPRGDALNSSARACDWITEGIGLPVRVWLGFRRSTAGSGWIADAAVGGALSSSARACDQITEGIGLPVRVWLGFRRTTAGSGWIADAAVGGALSSSASARWLSDTPFRRSIMARVRPATARRCASVSCIAICAAGHVVGAGHAGGCCTDLEG